MPGPGRGLTNWDAPLWGMARGYVDVMADTAAALSTVIPGAVIDGITLVAGMRVARTNQANPLEDRPYVVQLAGDPEPAPEWDRNSGAPAGASLHVLSGFKHAGSTWIQDTKTPVIPGVTTATWRKVSAVDDVLPDAYSWQSMGFGSTVANLAVALVSGQVMLWRVPLKAGRPIRGVQFHSGATALAAGVNQWAVLTDSARQILAISADGGAGAWGANTSKTFTFGTEYLPTEDATGYVGLMVNAGTVPSLWGVSDGGTVITGLTPMSAVASDAGLGAPPAVGTSFLAAAAKQQKIYFGLM